MLRRDGKERNRGWTDLDVGIKEASASLCEIFLLSKEGLLAFSSTRVAIEVALCPVHDGRSQCRRQWQVGMYKTEIRQT